MGEIIGLIGWQITHFLCLEMVGKKLCLTLGQTNRILLLVMMFGVEKVVEHIEKVLDRYQGEDPLCSRTDENSTRK